MDSYLGLPEDHPWLPELAMSAPAPADQDASGGTNGRSSGGGGGGGTGTPLSMLDAVSKETLAGGIAGMAAGSAHAASSLLWDSVAERKLEPSRMYAHDTLVSTSTQNPTA